MNLEVFVEDLNVHASRDYSANLCSGTKIGWSAIARQRLNAAMPSRRQILAVVMIACFCQGVGAEENVPPNRPNVLLIVSDDQGYNDLGVLGNGILTPTLDRLAAEGTRLTNFYVSWPACTPSRLDLDGTLSPTKRDFRHDPQRGARLWLSIPAGGVRG